MTPDPVRRLRDAVARLRDLTRDRPPTNLTHDDADDTVGTVATDDAVGFDPFPLLRALDRHGAEAVVIGQVAGILHGSRELTGDLDLLWAGAAGDPGRTDRPGRAARPGRTCDPRPAGDPGRIGDLGPAGDPGQAAAFAAAFASLSARLTDDDGHALPCDAAAFARPKVQFRTAEASGDCCTPALPWGDLPIADFIGRCRMVDAGDFVIRYLDRADLVRMRRAAGRPKDLRRADELDLSS